MKKLHSIGSIIIASIGLIHVTFGVIFTREFNSEILWFESLGLFMILVGFMNLTLLANKLIKNYLHAIQISNWICTAFFFLVVLADPMGIGIIAFLVQFGNSILSWEHIRIELNCCSKYSTS